MTVEREAGARIRTSPLAFLAFLAVGAEAAPARAHPRVHKRSATPRLKPPGEVLEVLFFVQRVEVGSGAGRGLALHRAVAGEDGLQHAFAAG